MHKHAKSVEWLDSEEFWRDSRSLSRKCELSRAKYA